MASTPPIAILHDRSVKPQTPRREKLPVKSSRAQNPTDGSKGDCVLYVLPLDQYRFASFSSQKSPNICPYESGPATSPQTRTSGATSVFWGSMESDSAATS